MLDTLAAAAPGARMGQPSDIAAIAAFLATRSRLDQRTDNPGQQRRGRLTAIRTQHKTSATIPAPIDDTRAVLGCADDRF